MKLISESENIPAQFKGSTFAKNMKVDFWLALLFIVLSNSIVFANTSVKEAITPNKTVVYKSIDDIELSLHVFNPRGHQLTDRVPVIVFFFGGGWNGGTTKQFYEQASYFAQKGIVAISAEYRVKKFHGTTPFESVKDAKSAIRWVREHAHELGVNPNKIVASGGSAGGHIAACTGLIDEYEEEYEDLSVSSKPNAMILYNPVLDTTEKGYGLKQVGEKRKTDISPNHHVKPGAAPSIVFHGEADKTVPFENAERFNILMKKAQNDCELESYKDKGHGFFNGPFFRGKNADTAIYDDIIVKSYDFLVSKLMDLKPSKVFSDHMVLQRDMLLPIWGTASPGEKITVEFAGQLKSTIANHNGHWQIQLDSLKASKEGRDLIIRGNENIVISDVLVGEVWICSGQSNMQMSYNAIPDISALVPKAKNLRSFEVKRTVSLKEADQIMGRWSVQPTKSAVALSFAYFLEKAGDVPVGIIHSSWGSSSLEAWMPRDMTDKLGDFKNHYARIRC